MVRNATHSFKPPYILLQSLNKITSPPVQWSEFGPVVRHGYGRVEDLGSNPGGLLLFPFYKGYDIYRWQRLWFGF